MTCYNMVYNLHYDLHAMSTTNLDDTGIFSKKIVLHSWVRSFITNLNTTTIPILYAKIFRNIFESLIELNRTCRLPR